MTGRMTFCSRRPGPRRPRSAPRQLGQGPLGDPAEKPVPPISRLMEISSAPERGRSRPLEPRPQGPPWPEPKGGGGRGAPGGREAARRRRPASASEAPEILYKWKRWAQRALPPPVPTRREPVSTPRPIVTDRRGRSPDAADHPVGLRRRGSEEGVRLRSGGIPEVREGCWPPPEPTVRRLRGGGQGSCSGRILSTEVRVRGFSEVRQPDLFASLVLRAGAIGKGRSANGVRTGRASRGRLPRSHRCPPR